MKKYIGNAFSLNMLAEDCQILIRTVNPCDVPQDAESCIGHESTAQAVSALLGRDVPMQRVAVSIANGDVIFVIALTTADGKPYRAPEGAILSASDLAALRLAIKLVEVL